MNLNRNSPSQVHAAEGRLDDLRSRRESHLADIAVIDDEINEIESALDGRPWVRDPRFAR